MKRYLMLLVLLALVFSFAVGCGGQDTLAEQADFALLSLEWENGRVQGRLRPGIDCEALTLYFVAETDRIFIDAPAVRWEQVSAQDELSFSISPQELDGSYNGVYKGTTKISAEKAEQLVADAVESGAYSAYLLYNDNSWDRLSFDLPIEGH